MRQGTRALAGAVALIGLLAAAAPSMAADRESKVRVVAVDGVATTACLEPVREGMAVRLALAGAAR